MKVSCAIFILVLFGLIGAVILNSSPAVSFLSSVDIKAEKKDLIIGYTALGQRKGAQYAGARHLTVRFGESGPEIANVSVKKRIEVSDLSHTSRFLKRIPLHRGDVICIGSVAKLIVADLSKTGFELSNLKTGANIKWEKGHLRPADLKIYQDSVLKKINRKRQWLLKGENEIPALFLGGTVNLPNKWAVPNTIPFAVAIVFQQGKFSLAPGREDKVLVVPEKTGKPVSFYNQWMPIVAGTRTITSCVIGRTHYKIRTYPDKGDASDTELRLIPVKNIPVFHGPALDPGYRSVSWIGDGSQTLVQWLCRHKLKVGILGLMAFVLAVGVWDYNARHLNRRRTLTLYSSCLLLCILGIGYTAKFSIDLKWMLGICLVIWFWATLALGAAGYLSRVGGSIWCCVIFLAGSGVLGQLQLLAGADNTSWLGFAWKQAFYVGGIGLLAGSFAALPANVFDRCLSFLGSDARFSRLFTLAKLIFALIIMVLLSFTVVIGDELGLGIFQVSELMKSVIVVIAAFVLLDISEIRTNPLAAKRVRQRRHIGIATDIILTLALMTGVALLTFASISDFSPALIIGLFSLAWVWQIAGYLKTSGIYLKVVLFFLLCGLIWCGVDIYLNPDGWASVLPQFERFAVWASPHLHPHSGGQVNTAMTMAGLGGLTGGDISWTGVNSMGNLLPAVQDDFILSFILYKFGNPAGLILLYVQLVYLVLLWRTGNRLLEITGHYAQVRSAKLLGFTIKGLVIIHALQWVISWGNALGLLPVMGQPMTWLSSGNSHLTFVAFFLLLAGLAGVRVIDSTKLNPALNHK